VIEAVPFFDDKNIPLLYWSKIHVETESRVTKIIKTRIVGEVRRTIQDQDFECISTNKISRANLWSIKKYLSIGRKIR